MCVRQRKPSIYKDWFLCPLCCLLLLDKSKLTQKTRIAPVPGSTLGPFYSQSFGKGLLMLLGSQDMLQVSCKRVSSLEIWHLFHWIHGIFDKHNSAKIWHSLGKTDFVTQDFWESWLLLSALSGSLQVIAFNRMHETSGCRILLVIKTL